MRIRKISANPRHRQRRRRNQPGRRHDRPSNLLHRRLGTTRSSSELTDMTTRPSSHRTNKLNTLLQTTKRRTKPLNNRDNTLPGDKRRENSVSQRRLAGKQLPNISQNRHKDIGPLLTRRSNIRHQTRQLIQKRLPTRQFLAGFNKKPFKPILTLISIQEIRKLLRPLLQQLKERLTTRTSKRLRQGIHNRHNIDK